MFLLRLLTYKQNSEIRKKNEIYEQGNVRMISEEEVNKARKDLVRFGNEWKKRKRECMDIVSMICDGANLKNKDFMVRIIISHKYQFRILQEWRLTRSIR